MNQFIQYALGHENVWFATMSEVRPRPRLPPSCGLLADAGGQLLAAQPRFSSVPPPAPPAANHTHPPTPASPSLIPGPQVIDWMKDPVSATQYRQQRQAKGCAPPTDMWFPSGEYCQAVRCVNGERGGGRGGQPAVARWATAGPCSAAEPDMMAAQLAPPVHAMACPCG
jgi:hypothetical protein